MNLKALKWTLAVCALTLYAGAGVAGTIVRYEFNTNETPDLVAAHVTDASSMDAPLSDVKDDSHSSGNPIPSYQADVWSDGSNRFEFSFRMADGYKLSLDRIVFDYQSEVDGDFMGPTEYDLKAGTNGSMVSLTGGWQALVRDNAWHADLTVSNNAGIVVGGGGQLTVQIFGRGASTSEAWWWIDNVTVYGLISPTHPELIQAALVSGNAWLSIQPNSEGLTCQVERASAILDGASWTSVYSFVATTAATNWSEPLPSGMDKIFYRVTVQGD